MIASVGALVSLALFALAARGVLRSKPWWERAASAGAAPGLVTYGIAASSTGLSGRGGPKRPSGQRQHQPGGPRAAWPASVCRWCSAYGPRNGASPRPWRSGVPARASVEVMALDLADLASIHPFTGALESRSGALELLVNNAGVASPSPRRTADGFELDFDTYQLGHFALTGLP
jgi:NAD(P)-dependent dehydrogenase (short-subunit alcohol dehydrogenase family)